jgi:hypothetical protein
LGTGGDFGIFAAPLGLAVPLGRAGATFFSEDRQSTCAKAQRELDYIPGYDLVAGMKRAVAWYCEERLLPSGPKFLAPGLFAREPLDASAGCHNRLRGHI